jgi:hypothetical protein
MVLSIDSTDPVLTITRSDPNGTRPVRTRAGTLPKAGTFTITDYEPAITGQIQYRITTATAEASAWATLGGMLPRFVMPSIPLFSVEVDNVYAYSATRESRATVHDVVGRRDPIIVQGKLGTRRGSMGIYCEDHGAAMRLTAMFERGQTVLYRQSEHQGMDMYFIPLTVSPSPASGRWELTVSYVEMDYPAGDVQSDPDWTFAKLAATGGTFAAVATGYRTFVDLVLGEAGT